MSKVDQLSQVLRYVTIPKDENDTPLEVKMESFMGFHAVHDQSASGLKKDASQIKSRMPSALLTIYLVLNDACQNVTKVKGYYDRLLYKTDMLFTQ